MPRLAAVLQDPATLCHPNHLYTPATYGARRLDALSYVKYTYVGISLNELDGLVLHCKPDQLNAQGKCPTTSGQQTSEYTPAVWQGRSCGRQACMPPVRVATGG